MASWIGIDFGTSNSAVACAVETAAPRLSSFPSAHGPRSTFPSVLYFESQKPASAGWPAIERYLATEHKGRFIQSLKTYLADHSFDGTVVGTKYFPLERLIALLGKHIGEHLTWPAPRSARTTGAFLAACRRRARRVCRRSAGRRLPSGGVRRDRVRV